jgi:voltage-gated potassium channel
MHASLKENVWSILNFDETRGAWSRVFKTSLMCLILLNVLAVILGTVPRYELRFGRGFRVFECFSVAIFTLEYLLRLWSSTSDPRFAGTVKGRFLCAKDPYSLIDLLAILPFYLPMLLPFDLRFLRSLRLLRLPQIFRLAKFSTALKDVVKGLRESAEEILIGAYVVLIFLVIGSGILYFVENEHQPQKFSSIPATMSWLLAKLTFLDYYDFNPVTRLGKALGMLLMFVGLGGVFLLPASVLSSVFTEHLRRQHKKPTACPHCKRSLE